MGIRVAAIGSFAPPTARFNEDWADTVISSWPTRNLDGFRPQTAGQHATLRAMSDLSADPFAGGKRRYVLREGETTSEMEIAAALDALARAGVAGNRLGLIIQQSTANDTLQPTNVTSVHKAVGAPESCFCVSVDSDNNSFLHALAIADRMLPAVAGDVAMIVNSSQRSRFVPHGAPIAPLFGDGATAVLITEDDNGGIVSQDHRARGAATHPYTVDAIEECEWLNGEVGMRVRNPKALAGHFMGIVDMLADSLNRCLALAGLAVDDLDVLACHQPSGWLLPALRAALELDDHTLTPATFPDFGSVAACNIPLALRRADEHEALTDGAMVALAAGGAGMTWSTAIVRWAS